MIQEKLCSEKIYKLVFDGEIMEGCAVDEVKRRLSGIFKWDQEKVDELFSVIPLEIADKIDFKTAMTYKAPFESAGAKCKIYHSKKGHMMSNESSLSPFLNYSQINSYPNMTYPKYDFGWHETHKGTNDELSDKKNLSHVGTKEQKENEQSRKIEIKTDLDSNTSIHVETKELLIKQKDELYDHFSEIYKQAKEKTAGKKFNLIMYALIGIFFALSFVIPMIAAMKGLYDIGIGAGLLMAFLASIIKYPISNKINKNRLLKTALYFKQHISIENQTNFSFYLAALILWAKKISNLDKARDEMLSVCNEIALANTTDIDKFKEYLKKIGDLDKRIKYELNNDKYRGKLDKKTIGESYELLFADY
ncbi:MAG: hypothetical protein ACMUIU_19235 [bacterium]